MKAKSGKIHRHVQLRTKDHLTNRELKPLIAAAPRSGRRGLRMEYDVRLEQLGGRPLAVVRRRAESRNSPRSFRTPAEPSGASSAAQQVRGPGGTSRSTWTVRSTWKWASSWRLRSPGTARWSARPPRPALLPRRPITGPTDCCTKHTRRSVGGAGTMDTRWRARVGRFTVTGKTNGTATRPRSAPTSSTLLVADEPQRMDATER